MLMYFGTHLDPSVRYNFCFGGLSITYLLSACRYKSNVFSRITSWPRPSGMSVFFDEFQVCIYADIGNPLWVNYFISVSIQMCILVS